MARFPRTEAAIKALAQNIVTGLAANAADFPAPPSRFGRFAGAADFVSNAQR